MFKFTKESIILFVAFVLIIVCVDIKINSRIDREIVSRASVSSKKEIEIPFNFFNDDELTALGIKKSYRLVIEEDQYLSIMNKLNETLEQDLIIRDADTGLITRKKYEGITHNYNWDVFTITKTKFEDINKNDEGVMDLCSILSVKYHLAQFDKLNIMLIFKSPDGREIATRTKEVGGK